MPGFNIAGQGARAGGTPDGLVEVRRTHRWEFGVLGPLDRKDIVLLKTANRPSLSFAIPEVHHNQEHVYLAGKHTWEPLSLSWYDAEQNPDVSDRLYKWISGEIGGDDGPFDQLPSMRVKRPVEYKRSATLHMLTGRGTINEEWMIHQAWPESVNWNALDYSSTDLQLIEMTLRYDRAVKTRGFEGEV